MSRHRIVRTMDYNDEYDGYDDIYGTSVDEDTCISPTDASQWIYDREQGKQSISAFIANNHNIKEENEDNNDVDVEIENKKRRDSESFQIPSNLNELEKAKLLSCVDEIRSIVGDTVSEKQIIETAMKYDYDVTKTLDVILNTTSSSPTLNKQQDVGIATKSFQNFAIGKEKGSNGAGIINAVPRLKIFSSESKTQFPLPTTSSSSLFDNATTAAANDNAANIVKTVQATGQKVKKGFDVNFGYSPKVQSPVVSGRNTPETLSTSDENQILKQQLGGNKTIKESLSSSVSLQQRNAQELYEKERGNEKSNLHMVVIGHVDAGKSTLMGHLLYDTGNISQRVMHKHEQESKKMGKQSFAFAWVLDETGEERARGITMDVGSSRIETDTKIVTLLDAPGHKDFIPNMISGATQADVALLVVDATRGEFETGFEQGGQTREHALLARSLGVNQLGVVINKLDTVNWSEDRFNEIVSKLRQFLKQAGFKDSDVTYIPCSGLTGENLVKDATEPELISWYKGPTLLKVIDNFKVPERSIDKPFRMSVTDIFKGTGSGFCISGSVETGFICVNDKILIGPSREQGQIKSISINDIAKQTAFAGDQATLTLSGIDINIISVGCILCDPQNPIPIASRIEVRLLVFNIKVPITIGYPVILHHQSLIEPASIVKLNAQLHKGTGEIIKKKPRCLGNNSCALVEIETTKQICVELYSDFKELGRIMLRVNGVTIAAGLITKIIK